MPDKKTDTSIKALDISIKLVEISTLLVKMSHALAVASICKNEIAKKLAEAVDININLIDDQGEPTDA